MPRGEHPFDDEMILRVEVRRLKYVKYELHKISSSADTLPFRDLIKIMSSGPSEGVHTTRGYSGLGILFENLLKSKTLFLTACVYHC